MSEDKKSITKKKEFTKEMESKDKEREIVEKTEITRKKTGPKVEKSKYIEAVGRRKRAVARVRIWTHGSSEFSVNSKPYESYFAQPELQQVASASLRKMKCLDRFKTRVLVKGGGLHAQAEAIRHGTARALIAINPDFRKRLKKAGFLTRDPRMRERKKFGLKRARRAPQWRKR